MAFNINPTSYKFNKTENIIIKYSYSEKLSYGYLYGLGDVSYSDSSTNDSFTFQPINKVGTFKCHIGTYNNKNEWMQSNDFTITIEEDSPPTNIPVESITINPTSKTINVGESLQMSHVILPTNATNKTVNYISLDTNVVTISSGGLIKGVNKGSAWVRVTSQDSKKFADAKITVNEVSTNIPVTSVSISPKTMNLNIGGTSNITSTISPSDATDKSFTYTSSNPSVATVDNDGTVKGIYIGVTTITVRTGDGGKTDTCNVTVNPDAPSNNPPTIGSVVVSDETYNGSYTLTYSASDKDNDSLTHKLKIDNGNYVSINPSKTGTSFKYLGNGLSVGNHTGTIQVSDGKSVATSKTFSIVINNKPTSIKEELKQAKNDYDFKHKSLKDTIRSIIEDGKYEEIEKETLDLAFANYGISLSKYREVSQKAVDSIAQKKSDDIKNSINKEIDDLNSALGGLENEMNNAFKDGVLSDAEKLAIKQNLQTISSERADVDKQYEVVYNNVDLIGTAKTNLKTSYDNYVSKYNSLVSTINTIVNKTGILDSSDQNNLNNAFTNYRSSSSDYSKKVNEAIDNIAKTKSERVEKESKKFTEAQIKIVNDSINMKVSREEYDSDKKIVDKKITEFTQTNEEFKYNLTQTGGENLLSNSNFDANGYLWGNHNGANLQFDTGFLNKSYGKMIGIECSRTGGIFQHIKTVPGQKYTVSFYAESNGLRPLRTNIGIEGVRIITLEHEPGFKRWSFEFIAQKTDYTFIAYSIDPGKFYLGRPMVNKGVLIEYSPKKNEIYSTDVRFDINGIYVESKNANTLTNVSSNGLEVFEKSSNTPILTAKNGDVIARGGHFKVTHPQNGEIVLWGRDVVINGGRALVGTGNVSELGTNKLWLNYSNDFFNGVHISGKTTFDNSVKKNGLEMLCDSGLNTSETGYQKLSNGLILQWGVFGGFGDQNTTIWFPVAFPSKCVYVGTEYDGDPDCVWDHWVFNTNNAQTQIRTLFNRGAGRDRNRLIKWFAVGN